MKSFALFMMFLFGTLIILSHKLGWYNDDSTTPILVMLAIGFESILLAMYEKKK